jgi:hypothetical protein
LRNAGCQRIFSNSITFDRLINIFI